MLIAACLIFFLYALLMLGMWYGWRSIPRNPEPIASHQLKISVLIPARNEEENIGALLTSLQGQTYPADLTQIIVIDDHSTDNTAKIVSGFTNVILTKLEDVGINSYKKKAIEKGVSLATGELIIMTDADCIPGSDWLSTIVDFKARNDSTFIAAPVRIRAGKSFLQIFQSMDFMVLQGVTGGGVHLRKLMMCNGANLAYEKKAFEKVNGFEGIDRIASGDDMLLMQKIALHFPRKIHYLKSEKAIMDTAPMHTWKAFFSQRIRWASKAGKYKDKRILPVLVLVYMVNLFFPVLLIAGFFDPGYWIYAACLLAGKTLVELPFFVSVSRFFNQARLIPLFIFFQPVHIIYTIVSGFLGQTGKYEWKGRKVN